MAAALNVDDLLMDASCGVCYTLYAEDHPDIKGARVLKCGHTTCGSCLRQILAHRPNCPNCRVRLRGHLFDYPIARQLATLGASLTQATTALQDQSAKIADRDAQNARLKAALATAAAAIAALSAPAAPKQAELKALPDQTAPTVTAAAAAAQVALAPAPSSPKVAVHRAKNKDFQFERFLDLRMRRGRVEVCVVWAGDWSPRHKQTWEPLRNVPNGSGLRALISDVYGKRPNVFKECVRDELTGHGVDIKELMPGLKKFRDW